MNTILVFIKDTLWFLFPDMKCEFCRKKLRRNGDKYYGGIFIKDTIGGKSGRTAYLCNLCYMLFNK